MKRVRSSIMRAHGYRKSGPKLFKNIERCKACKANDEDCIVSVPTITTSADRRAIRLQSCLRCRRKRTKCSTTNRTLNIARRRGSPSTGAAATPDPSTPPSSPPDSSSQVPPSSPVVSDDINPADPSASGPSNMHGNGSFTATRSDPVSRRPPPPPRARGSRWRKQQQVQSDSEDDNGEDGGGRLDVPPIRTDDPIDVAKSSGLSELEEGDEGAISASHSNAPLKPTHVRFSSENRLRWDGDDARDLPPSSDADEPSDMTGSSDIGDPEEDNGASHTEPHPPVRVMAVYNPGDVLYLPLAQGEEVTPLAKRDGLTLVLDNHGRAGWVPTTTIGAHAVPPRPAPWALGLQRERTAAVCTQLEKATALEATTADLRALLQASTEAVAENNRQFGEMAKEKASLENRLREAEERAQFAETQAEVHKTQADAQAKAHKEQTETLVEAHEAAMESKTVSVLKYEEMRNELVMLRRALAAVYNVKFRWDDY